MSSEGRIMVIRGGAIGDFILTFPVLAALRQNLPNARLHVMGYTHIVRLARLGGLVDEVHSIEDRALASFFARGGELDGPLSAQFNRFHVILSFLYDPDEVFLDNVDRVSDAQFISGPWRPRDEEGVHASEVLLQPLQRLAIFDANPVPRLALPGEDAVSGNGGHAPGGWQRTLAVHPGSGSETKNWPEPLWIELLKRVVAETDWNVAICGGEAEGERLERIRRALPDGRIRLWRSVALDELAGRLHGCGAFVGHDSGISHLAAAVGLPVLALWGRTSESVWAPRGEEVNLLKAPGGELTQLPMDTVWEATARLIDGRKKKPARS